MKLYKRPLKAWSLLNHTPFDGCLLVFNAKAPDWRARASQFKKRYDISFAIHSINGASKAQAHDPEVKSDLYITVKKIYGGGS